jgi:membrane-bound serine protease (ClpP class)
MSRFLAITFLALALGGLAGRAAERVDTITIDGAIGPATAGYIVRAVDQAAADSAQCLVIRLDTPGGLLDSTKTIVQKLLSSPVPVVVFVGPPGAVAGSAGCFITLAADIAAMAPGTTIGAAHPVSVGGNPTGGGEEKPDETMKQKLENYSVSFIENIASQRHRNVEWAKSSVKDSEAITSEKAFELKVIDLIAKDVPDLLKQIDGREIRGQLLKTAGANVVEIPMSPGEKLFQALWSPEVLFILMLMVIYGVMGELSSPGAILPGVVGAIALVLVLYLSARLPVNIAGLAFMGLAIALFIVDIYAPTHGVLTTGGVVSFFFGALMLFDRADPVFRLSLSLIIPATVVTALFFIFIVGAGLRAQRLPVRSGRETMLGQVVLAQSRIDAVGGRVFIEGESWNAVSEVVVEKLWPVEVIGVEGLTLKVKPINAKPTT